MNDVFALALYLNGQPIIIETKGPSNFKSLLDLCDQAASVPFTTKQHVTHLSDDASTVAIIENLLIKPPAQALLILLTSPHCNPFIVDDLYMHPAIDTLKQACGGTIKSLEHLQKYAGSKYRTEIESDFSDILNGLQMIKVLGKGGSARFQKKHVTDFYEIKYAEVASGQQKIQDQMNSVKGVTLQKVQSAIQKMVIGIEKAEASVQKKIEVKVTERMEITMEGQQIQNASIVGRVGIKSEGMAVPLTIQIDDKKWLDSQKVQIINQVTEKYSQENQVHLYEVKINQLKLNEICPLEYRVNPQMLSELPILVMWTNNMQQQGIFFHLKYMLNQGLAQFVDSLTFSMGRPPFTIHSDDLKRLKADQQYSKIDAISQQYVKLKLANPKQSQGIIEFTCSIPVKQISIEVSLKDRLVSGLTNISYSCDEQLKGAVLKQTEMIINMNQ